jgi:hypothetical protein
LVIQSTCLSGGKEGQIPIEPMQITVWPWKAGRLSKSFLNLGGGGQMERKSMKT